LGIELLRGRFIEADVRRPAASLMCRPTAGADVGDFTVSARAAVAAIAGRILRVRVVLNVDATFVDREIPHRPGGLGHADELYRGLQLGPMLRETLAVEPLDTVNDFPSAVLYGAGEAMVSARSAEGEEVTPGPNYPTGCIPRLGTESDVAAVPFFVHESARAARLAESCGAGQVVRRVGDDGCD
jgi:hypothetical protein